MKVSGNQTATPVQLAQFGNAAPISRGDCVKKPATEADCVCDRRRTDATTINCTPFKCTCIKAYLWKKVIFTARPLFVVCTPKNSAVFSSLLWHYLFPRAICLSRHRLNHFHTHCKPLTSSIILGTDPNLRPALDIAILFKIGSNQTANGFGPHGHEMALLTNRFLFSTWPLTSGLFSH